MTPSKIAQVLTDYDNSLNKYAKENSTEGPNRWGDLAGDDSERISHAHWMVREAITFIAAGRIEKAHRWLGFIQGVLWSCGHFTIDQMKEHNRPDEVDPVSDTP